MDKLPPIDRYHSQPFSYHANTDSLALQQLSKVIWQSFSDEDRTNIDGTSNNKGNLLGQDYLLLIIIQLFVHWKSDPSLCLGTPRGNDTINVRDFYNTKMISSAKLVRVFDTLISNGYVDHVNHTYIETSNNKNTTSRIRTNKKLHLLFREVNASEFDVDLNADTKQIHLTDWVIDDDGDLVKDLNNKKAKEYLKYDENEPHIVAKLKVLTDYNNLLRRTHVDLSNLERPYIVRQKKNKKTSALEDQLIPITQQKKFVRRIFSRGSWEANGRFYGGFWQQIGSEYRHHIRINGNTTVELDYSSLHPNILLVEQGVPPSEDVYTISEQPILKRFDLSSQRKIIKMAVMMLLNADRINKAYNALMNTYKTPKGEQKDPRSTITYKEFELFIEAFIKNHPSLKNLIGKDQGIRLMYKDSQIIEYIIENFTNENIPILCVHDSIIVEEQHVNKARQEMKRATKKIIGTELNFDQNRITYDLVNGTRTYQDKDFTQQYVETFTEQYPKQVADRHKAELKKFQEWKLSKEMK
ncbi:hypothetical protein N9Y08_02260 [Paracoccaceae bacterium]|nr:hypothetical protein [Paracoccaceae bacterium]